MFVIPFSLMQLYEEEKKKMHYEYPSIPAAL